MASPFNKILHSIGRFFGGKKPKEKKVPIFTEQQQGALDKLLQQGLSDTDLTALENRLKDIYTQETVPSIAGHFASKGGGQRSSAFANALRTGAMGLSSQLAGLRSNTGMQKLQMALQPQYHTVYEQGSPGFLGEMAGPLTQMLGGQMFRGGQQQAGDASAESRGQYYPGQPKGMQNRAANPAMLKLLLGALL